MATRFSQHVITENGRTIYLNNKELLPEVIMSQERGEMTKRLAKMLLVLCQNYARKSNFANYSYNEEMQGYAMMMLVRTWKSFNVEKSSNPFAFYTQCIKNSFIQYLNYERKQRRVRDTIQIQQGLNPSFNYEDNGKTYDFVEDETDFDTIRSDSDRLRTATQQYGHDIPIERDDHGREIIQEPSADDDDGPVDNNIPDPE